MNKTGIFEKYKSKVLKEYYFKFSIYSFSFALISAGITLLILFLINSSSSLLFWLPILVSVIFFVTSLFLLIHFKTPSETTIALRIDNDLNLHEKTATMIEFQNQSGLLINKQRSDAVEKLKSNTPKNITFKIAWLSIGILVFSAGVFTSSFFIPRDVFPQSEKTLPIDDETHEIVEDAKDHAWDYGATEDVTNELMKLLDDAEADVKGITDVSKRTEILDDYISKVDPIVDKANTKEEIGNALVNSGDNELRLLGTGIITGNYEDISKGLSAVESRIKNCDDDELPGYLAKLSYEIYSSLNESNVNKNDTLYQALYQFINILKKYQADLQNKKTTYEKVKENISLDIDKIQDIINSGISVQKNNISVGEYIKKKLEEMKNPQENENQDKQSDRNNSRQDQQSDDPNQSGGESNQDDHSGESNKSGNSGENGESEDGQSGNSGDAQGSGDQTSSSSGEGESGGDSSKSGDDDQKKGSGGKSEEDEKDDDGKSGEGGSSGGKGSGDTIYAGRDHVYTDKGDTEYGKVIDDYHNQAIGDATKNSDDNGITDAIDDYFHSLYGDGNP